jgi:N-acyl amino acid synthase of PEP-CTERM/exosortase system
MITSSQSPAESRTNGTPDPLTPHFRFGRQPYGENLAGSTDIFALRYAVYCLECHFLDAAHYEDGLESDEYDAGSAHFTAHNLANELVGSLRLVHASPALGFPFERHCTALFGDIALPPEEQCGEVSRLVVRRDYRRRAGDTLAGVPKEFLDAGAAGVPARRPPTERRSNSPELLLGLYREMYQYSLEREIRYWYAAMERSLARALSRFQFVFVPIGMEVDYYGPVAPYLADLREMEERLGRTNPDLLAWFRRG